MAVYVRHRPENSILYQSIARSWSGIMRDYAIAGEPIPRHVESEFERYQKCGILDYGFIRLVCKSCGEGKFLGFSCKGRGFCPSCGSRRREQTADRLEAEVWPIANARQWVLTFPHQVRHWLSHSKELLGDVIRVVTDEIAYFYESNTTKTLGASVQMPASGAITFVQLFGSNLSLNPHLHMILLDGSFGRSKSGIQFYPQEKFDTESMFDVLNNIYKRLDKLFRKRGYVRDDGEVQTTDQDGEVPMPFRPRAPKKYRRKGLKLSI